MSDFLITLLTGLGFLILNGFLYMYFIWRPFKKIKTDMDTIQDTLASPELKEDVGGLEEEVINKLLAKFEDRLITNNQVLVNELNLINTRLCKLEAKTGKSEIKKSPFRRSKKSNGR